jgi:hypothetical protein
MGEEVIRTARSLTATIAASRPATGSPAQQIPGGHAPYRSLLVEIVRFGARAGPQAFNAAGLH